MVPAYTENIFTHYQKMKFPKHMLLLHFAHVEVKLVMHLLLSE
jgi:hypothetical protein